MTLKGLLAPLLWGVLASSTPPVLAISGQVVDPTGKPVKGARACLVLADREGLCAKTDEVGYYRLPDSNVSKVRISAADFLPSMVAAVDLDRAIVLDRAASLRARLLDDASGESVAGGNLSLSYKTGRKRGPFPPMPPECWFGRSPPGRSWYGPRPRATGRPKTGSSR